MAKSHGFTFIDMTDVIQKYAQDNGSLLARFALFADNAHPSPLGHQLAAAALFNALGDIVASPARAASR
jgi:phospholipase/lecithinase/hemolysin